MALEVPKKPSRPRYGGRKNGRPFIVNPPKRGIRLISGPRSYLNKSKISPATRRKREREENKRRDMPPGHHYVA